MARGLVVSLLLALVLPASASAAAGYGWPLEPFDQEHAVRAYFGDPRLERAQASFHFGIDIPAADGTPVYAVEPGYVHLHEDGLAIVSGHRTFGYWHVVAAVRQGRLVRRDELVGHVRPGWGHLHFAERTDHHYVNPLRLGGLRPFLDVTTPTITAIAFSRDDRPVSRLDVTGAADITVYAYDTPPARMIGPWAGAVVAPALIHWRIERRAGVVTRWRAAVDFRGGLEPNRDFREIYAPGTYENRPGRPGRYRYYLARGWRAGSLTPGRYTLVVEAVDLAGNTAEARLAFHVR